MKKTLAIMLTVLMAFSMFSVAASAASVTVHFINGNKQIKEVTVDSSNTFDASLFPVFENEQFELDEKQDDGTTKTYRYTFQVWKVVMTGKLYYPGTFEVDGTESEIWLEAQYTKEDISGRQSFWNLIESIFARINLIFEYFATIFNF